MTHVKNRTPYLYRACVKKGNHIFHLQIHLNVFLYNAYFYIFKGTLSKEK